MTNLEALKANLSQVHGLVISDNAYAKALIDQDVTGSETYLKENEKSIDLATLRLYEQILGSASFSEGGVSYNLRDGIKEAITAINRKWGLTPNHTPVINNASDKW